MKKISKIMLSLAMISLLLITTGAFIAFNNATGASNIGIEKFFNVLKDIKNQEVSSSRVAIGESPELVSMVEFRWSNLTPNENYIVIGRPLQSDEEFSFIFSPRYRAGTTFIEIWGKDYYESGEVFFETKELPAKNN